MKQTILAWAVCAVLALALAGCGSTSSPSSSSAQTGSSSSAASSSSEASSVSQSSSASQANSGARASSVAREEIDSAAFHDMMNALAGYQPGTAGANLKLYIAACGALNFSEGYDAAQEEALRDALEQTLSSMDQQQREALTDTFPAVDGAARNILKDGVESVSGILSDAGDPNLYDSYDAEKYELVSSILAECLEADG